MSTREKILHLITWLFSRYTDKACVIFCQFHTPSPYVRTFWKRSGEKPRAQGAKISADCRVPQPPIHQRLVLQCATTSDTFLVAGNLKRPFWSQFQKNVTEVVALLDTKICHGGYSRNIVLEVVALDTQISTTPYSSWTSDAFQRFSCDSAWESQGVLRQRIGPQWARKTPHVTPWKRRICRRFQSFTECSGGCSLYRSHVKSILLTCLQHSESLYAVREHKGCIVLKKYVREYGLVL